MNVKSDTDTVSGVIKNIVIKGPEEDGRDEGFFSKVKEIINDLGDSMRNKKYAFEVFEKNLLFLKSFGIVFLIILAIVNYVTYKNTGLVSQKPLLFFAESCVFGISGVVPFLLLCMLRNNNYFNNKQILNASIAIFLVFFSANYLLEISGIYPVIFKSENLNNSKDNTKDNSNDNKEDDYSFKELKNSLGSTSDIVLIFIFAASVFSLFFATAFVKDTSPEYTNFKDLSPLLVFIIEMLLFGIISAVPIFFMASNRNVLSGDTTKEFIIIVFKFSLLHSLLQLSGFYKYLFTGSI
jgi:hypothetical protein